jgi:hypothetical protein
MLEEVIAEVAPGTPIHDVDATDPIAAERLRFPGSPTIRVDGRDIDPTYSEPSDYTAMPPVSDKRRIRRASGASLDRGRSARRGNARGEISVRLEARPSPSQNRTLPVARGSKGARGFRVVI